MAKGDAQPQNPGGATGAAIGGMNNKYNNAPRANFRANAQLPGTPGFTPQMPMPNMPGQAQINQQGMKQGVPFQGDPMAGGSIAPSNPGALIAAILAQRYGGGSPTDPAGAMGMPPNQQGVQAGMAMPPPNMGMMGGAGGLIGGISSDQRVNTPGMGYLGGSPNFNESGGIGYGSIANPDMPQQQVPWGNVPPMSGAIRQPIGIGPSNPDMLLNSKQQRYNSGQL